ncbi:MAG TPA: PolC-type DNA polymerase III [Clostridia bacterium]|nr:PolC-type DNA polymerase III [Clostridia bacterium]
MDERLQNIFLQNGAEGAELANVRLHKRDNRLEAAVRLKQPLAAPVREKIRADMERLMAGLQVELCFEPSEAGLAPPEVNVPDAGRIISEWCDFDPFVRPALVPSYCEMNGQNMTVRIPERLSGKFCTESDVRAFCEHMKETYGVSLSIAVVGDPKLAAPEYVSPEELIREEVKNASKPAAKAKGSGGSGGAILGGPVRLDKLMKQSELEETAGTVTIQGEIINLELRPTKAGGGIINAAITDLSGTTLIKLFFKKGEEKLYQKIEDVKNDGDYLVVHGPYRLDQFLGRMCVFPDAVSRIKKPRREDTAEETRVELHLHTQMSSMDALVKPEDAVNTAARFGHKAVAITDHGVVQAFPAAVSAAEKLKKSGKDIKVVLGVEGYLIPDCELIPFQSEYVAVSCLFTRGVGRAHIFELAAARFDGDTVKESFRTLVNPAVPVEPKLLKRALVTQEELADACTLKEALASLAAFCGDSIKVVFDAERMKLISAGADEVSVSFGKLFVDIGMLAHYLRRDLKAVTLPNAARAFCTDCAAEEALSAPERAKALAGVTEAILKELQEKNIESLPLSDCDPPAHVKGRRSNYHIILLAQNHEGLMNLYRLVSYSHLEHLKKVPQIPRSLLNIHRQGIIVGSACEAGEVFRAVLEEKDEEALVATASFYDYLEIQPVGNNEFLLRDGKVKDIEGLRNLNRRIVALGDQLNKPVVATGDVHFLNPEDAVFRAILMHAREFKDAEQQAPLYFKTTADMLEEFSYLGEDRAFEVVVTNPNAIADSCERMKPYLDEKRTYAPTFPGANDELTDMAMKRAHELYGDVLPDMVQARLDKELKSIIGNGYASLYLMAQRLVKKSLDDGYLVGSRGSVGSSFVATMAGITEVNPLSPHYVCPNCRHSEFDVDREKYACGVDMPDKNCPDCGAKYQKLGYDIPFEVFLGFKGDKTPDIDLNFSGEYQPVAHKFTEVMFGEGHAFRAGTISGLQDKTVYGYVKSYCDDNKIVASREEVDRLVKGCTGVKRTTGQHPGGIVIVPEEHDIMEFTPIQYPADNKEKNIVTTHFDFHAMDDKLVKLDILGHDDPTALRMLQDLTGVDPKTIALDDQNVMRLFSSGEPLKVSLNALGCDVGSLAVPEFGTVFVREKILMMTRPTTMEELVRISGLSHGTDVWLGNAQELVAEGIGTLSQVICTRDDIMNYLIRCGLDPSMSFKIMESVRKGRGVTEEMESAMQSVSVPAWFIGSCKKIKYLFPRAHAAAYVMMAFRVAYYKVYHPLEFYVTYFTVRADAFDIAYASGGAEMVLKRIKDMRKNENDLEQKQKDLITILEVVYEMNLRGIELLDVDVYKSAAKEFKIENGAIRPPFLAVAGVGENAAEGIAKAQNGHPYASVEEFRMRTRCNSAVIKNLCDVGCLNDLPETNQLSLF